MREFIMDQDKTQKFRKRLEKLEQTNPKQNTYNISWIKVNFPELF